MSKVRICETPGHSCDMIGPNFTYLYERWIALSGRMVERNPAGSVDLVNGRSSVQKTLHSLRTAFGASPAQGGHPFLVLFFDVTSWKRNFCNFHQHWPSRRLTTFHNCAHLCREAILRCRHALHQQRSSVAFSLHRQLGLAEPPIGEGALPRPNALP
ncbi:unnamed protein product [Nesidiocoris tenuis]|uniref:Uncharacterized protein n=1 Tax=Nesidiocoris tenuis TaxID=355587 RepID=A0A6H5GND0_9HEMI|nr:unnamed protein product [Nesidiocoris tenuis]